MNVDRDDVTTNDVDEAYRAAVSALDERPDARVRAAVLAAAARAVDAKPRDVATPFRAHRRGWSIAAVLVVSVMTGLVAMQASRERPDFLAGRSTARVEVPSPRTDVATTSPAPAAPPPRTAPTSTPEPARPDAARVAASSPREVVRPAPTRRPEPAVEGRRIVRAQPFPNAVGEANAPIDKVAPAPRPSEAFADARAAAPPPAPSAQASSSPPATTDLHLARSSSNDASMRAKTQSAPTQAADEEDPARWAARIVRLRAAGSDDQADRELARLRERHPSFVVPHDALRIDGTR